MVWHRGEQSTPTSKAKLSEGLLPEPQGRVDLRWIPSIESCHPSGSHHPQLNTRHKHLWGPDQRTLWFLVPVQAETGLRNSMGPATASFPGPRKGLDPIAFTCSVIWKDFPSLQYWLTCVQSLIDRLGAEFVERNCRTPSIIESRHLGYNSCSPHGQAQLQ